MPTIKQILDALMMTRTTKAEAASASMPSSNKIIIPVNKSEVTTWETVATYTAPSDGYVQLQGESTNTNAVMAVVAAGTLMNTTNFPWVAYAGGGYIPVRKGNVLYLTAQNMKTINAAFFKTLGGGKNPNRSMLYGGLLWLLNPLFKHWSRQHTEPHSQLAKALLSLQRAEQALVKLPRSTGMWHASSQVSRTSNSLISSLMGAGYRPQSRRMQHHGVVRGCQSEKVKLSTFTLLDQVAQRFSLRNQDCRLNFVGGIA